MNQITDHEALALNEYFRRRGEQPDRGLTQTIERNGRTYVVLANVNGVLAVYKFADDKIRYLAKAPAWAEAAIR